MRGRGLNKDCTTRERCANNQQPKPAHTILNDPKSTSAQALAHHLYTLISNRFGISVDGPEKAGVGGSTPSLATILQITFRPLSQSSERSTLTYDGSMDHVQIRPAQTSDLDSLARMFEALWPKSSAEDHRHLGIGKKLVGAAEDWARGHRCVEMASDAIIENEVSQRAHENLGYEVVDRCVHYRKKL